MSKSILPTCNLSICECEASDCDCDPKRQICQVSHYTIIEQENTITGAKRYNVVLCFDISTSYGNYKHYKRAITRCRELYYLEAISANSWLTNMRR